MHGHPDPRRTIAATVGALVLALMAFMLAESPVWLQDPLASPLEELRSPR